MRRIKEMLTRKGYNLRERANIYAGTIMGALAPIVALRYMLTIPTAGEHAVISEGAAWGVSALSNAATSIVCYGFPLLYTTVAGAMMGSTGAYKLKQKRIENERRIQKESSIEKMLQTN